MSYKGENVESARVEVVAICTRLEEKTLVPADSVNDIINPSPMSGFQLACPPTLSHSNVITVVATTSYLNALSLVMKALET